MTTTRKKYTHQPQVFLTFTQGLEVQAGPLHTQ